MQDLWCQLKKREDDLEVEWQWQEPNGNRRHHK